MSSYAQTLKRQLICLIRQMADNPEQFSKCPGKDFTRTRKLGMERTLSILLAMEGKSLNNELLDYFCYTEPPSTSAFVQSRAKLHPNALPSLFQKFVASQKSPNFFRGFRLLAADGSTLQIPSNPSDADSCITCRKDQWPINLLHLTAIYDLCNLTYSDAIVEGGRSVNERAALCRMIMRSDIEKAILLADRGFESFDLLAHIQQKGWKFLFRIKDKSGIAAGLDLPKDTNFDIPIELRITSRRTNYLQSLLTDRNRYKFVHHSKFDYAGLATDHDGFFHLCFRIVRLKISDSLTETLITNLDRDNFQVSTLKKLYAMRWGIETSFRKLKYTLGLLHFHAKKVENIHQEIFARLIMYNFYELITSHTIIHSKNRKYAYTVNFSVAAHICRQFFRGNVSPPLLEALLLKYILPIRPNRSYPRVAKTKGVVSFAYRIA